MALGDCRPLVGLRGPARSSPAFHERLEVGQPESWADRQCPLVQFNCNSSTVPEVTKGWVEDMEVSP